MLSTVPISSHDEDIALFEAHYQNLMTSYYNGLCKSVDDYTKCTEISSSVYKAVDNETRESVVIKKLSTEDKSGNGIASELYREVSILKNIKHENIVLLKEIVVGRNMKNMYIVLEACDEDLGRVIDEMKMPFTQVEIKCLMKQLFTGLDKLHKSFIIHRDIKPSNLLLNNTGVLKITDFGSARSFSLRMTPKIGTMGYTAPEITFEFQSCSSAVDIWSAGCVMGELFKGSPLFSSKSQLDFITSLINLLGTPNDKVMPGFTDCSFAASCNLKQQPYNRLGKTLKTVPKNAITFLKSLLCYNACLRPQAFQCIDGGYIEEEPKPIDCLALKVSIKHKRGSDLDMENIEI